MKTITSIAFSVLSCAALLTGQSASDTPDAHVAIARSAAGTAYQNLFNFLCTVPLRAVADQWRAPRRSAARPS